MGTPGRDYWGPEGKCWRTSATPATVISSIRGRVQRADLRASGRTNGSRIPLQRPAIFGKRLHAWQMNDEENIALIGGGHTSAKPTVPAMVLGGCGPSAPHRRARSRLGGANSSQGWDRMRLPSVSKYLDDEQKPMGTDFFKNLVATNGKTRAGRRATSGHRRTRRCRHGPRCARSGQAARPPRCSPPTSRCGPIPRTKRFQDAYLSITDRFGGRVERACR